MPYPQPNYQPNYQPTYQVCPAVCVLVTRAVSRTRPRNRDPRAVREDWPKLSLRRWPTPPGGIYCEGRRCIVGIRRA